MEGVKILSEEMIKVFGGSTLYPILILVGLIILLFSVWIYIYYGFEAEGVYMFFLGSLLFIISIIGGVGNSYYEKKIKVIPIGDKYFIDVTKYRVIEVEGEIIYLKDNNKYNEEGEVIE